MNLRKLEKSEHQITRALWEEIFTEDTESFLDYYYQVKTADNSIYIIEETKNSPVSMLQLNPYIVRFLNQDKVLHYIIAVATKKEYRGKGYMTKLLKAAAGDMYRKGEPFTFLMPAAEGIYYPHDFRFIYSQSRVCGKIGQVHAKQEMTVKIREAGISDCCKLSEFAEKMLSGSELIRTVRTEQYYRTVLKEQQSEGGSILMAEKGGRFLGFVLCGYDGERAELREPLFYHEEIWESIMDYLKKRNIKEFCAEGILPGFSWNLPGVKDEISRQETPLIMARIVHLKNFLESFRARSNFHLSINIKDDMIPENTGYWEIQGKEKENLTAEKKKSVQNGGAASTGDVLISLFGYRGGKKGTPKEANIEKVLKMLSEETDGKPSVFLNEIV